jgi:ketosteroid isomerase-like protein
MSDVKRLLALAMLTVLLEGTANVASSAATPVMSGAEAAVLDAESQRFRAQVEKDVATLNALLADDVSYTHSTGTRQTKAEYIKDIVSGNMVYKAIEPSNQKVRVYGNTAVITGTVKVSVSVAGTERAVALLYTDVHVKRGGRWQLVAWQSTTKAQ